MHMIRSDRPCSNYHTNRLEVDPFPDPSLMDPADGDQEQEVNECIESMLVEAQTNGFPVDKFPQLKTVILARRNVFRISFSAGPPANVPPLRIQLKPDAQPTVVRLRKYSSDQKLFLRKLMKRLIDLDYVYPNPTSKWDPLLI